MTYEEYVTSQFQALFPTAKQIVSTFEEGSERWVVTFDLDHFVQQYTMEISSEDEEFILHSYYNPTTVRFHFPDPDVVNLDGDNFDPASSYYV